MKAHLITIGIFLTFTGFTMVDKYFPFYVLAVGMAAAVYWSVYQLIKEFTE